MVSMIQPLKVPSGKVSIWRNSDIEPDDYTMQFHLTYEGPLYGPKQCRPDHKQEIRQVFHTQLKKFWQIHPWLNQALHGKYEAAENINPMTPLRDGLAQRFSRGAYKFVPLVRAEDALLCSLDILFLRPDRPGSMIESGDIDGRLKTLFDGLKMPGNTGEFGSKYQEPKEGEDPFYCLLEDDKLITHVSLETDTLLEPTKLGLSRNETTNDARLVIGVKITPYFPTWGNIGYGGG